jgi:Holliday junction resolvase RusA-like endonuclease
MCEEAGWSLGGTLDVHFVVPMPPSWSKTKAKEMCGKPHQQKPDIDNLCKAVMDFFGVDDGHVHTLYASKSWGVTGSITVKP